MHACACKETIERIVGGSPRTSPHDGSNFHFEEREKGRETGRRRGERGEKRERRREGEVLRATEEKSIARERKEGDEKLWKRGREKLRDRFLFLFLKFLKIFIKSRK